MQLSLLSIPAASFFFKRISTPQELVQLLRHCRTLTQKQIHQIHCSILTRGLNQNNTLLCNFIAACFSLGFSGYAHSIFTHQPEPSVQLCNTVIKSLSVTGSPKEAVLVLKKIQALGLRPDSYSFPFVLRASIRLSSIGLGKQIHCQAVGIGLESDVHVATALVQMYSHCGCIENAQRVFDQMPNSGYVALWNAMVASLVRAGKVDTAAEVFYRMPVKDVISWTSLIAGFSQNSRPGEAIRMFQRMLLIGPEPDEVSMLAALSACAQLGALELGEWIHHYINHRKLKKTIPIQNALIDLYAKSGEIRKALKVFETMKTKSIVSWTAVIAGLALNGKGREALDMFAEMERSQVSPNEITFLAVLSGCGHSGLVEIGCEFFHMMSTKYSIHPQVEHYGCLIDLLGRGNYLEEAMELLRNMPFEANAAIWGSLLFAAKIHSNIHVAKLALEKLMELEPGNSGNFALMSNLYAGLGRWGDCGMIRKVLRDSGIKKKVGWSSVELGGEVHEFVSDDRSHSQADVIYEILANVAGHLKIAGEEIQDDDDGFLEYGETLM